MPLIFSQAEIKKVSWQVIVYILVGILAVCLIGLIPEGSFQSDMEAGMVSYLMLVLAGIFAAVALVLPGISVSYLFLVWECMMRSCGPSARCTFPSFFRWEWDSCWA